MIIFSSYAAPGHAQEGHVERPARVSCIVQQVTREGLFDQRDGILRNHSSSRYATREEIGLVHSYFDDLQEKIGRDDGGLNGGNIQVLADLDDPDGCTYATHTTFTDAQRACGVVLDLVDIICDGEGGDTKACAVVRPPGHHATHLKPLGFCIFNNVAISAKYAMQNFQHIIKKVLIVDFDLHNGNGTIESFYNDDTVGVVDIHEKTQVYIGNDTVEATGEGKGEGYTINVPLESRAGHESAVRVVEEIIKPFAARFKPDMLIVSAGFDGHKDDPFHSLSYSEDTYAYFGDSLSTLSDMYCDGRILFVLEGGYNTTATALSLTSLLSGAAHIKTVSGTAESTDYDEQSFDVIRRVKQIHQL